jgi:hypothetical protein
MTALDLITLDVMILSTSDKYYQNHSRTAENKGQTIVRTPTITLINNKLQTRKLRK